jgi:hypothetical protein
MKKLLSLALLFLAGKAFAIGPFIGYVQISTATGVKQSGGFNVGRSTVTAICFDSGGCMDAPVSSGAVTGQYFATSNGKILWDGYPDDPLASSIFVGIGASPTGSFGGNNVCVGSQTCATYTTSANQNTIVGDRAGRNVLSGNNNTALGAQALGGLDATGSGDRTTAVGANALSGDGTAHECTAVGWNAGGSSSGCNSNDFFGFNSGNSGSFPIVYGTQNECIGSGTCTNLTGGNSNTCLGQNTSIGSLFNGGTCTGITTSSLNTMIGAGAASQNATNDSSSTYVGALSGNATANKLVDAIAIGYRAVAVSSFTAQIGAYNTADSVTLHVSSGAVDGGYFQLSSKTSAQIKALTPAVNPNTGSALGQQYYCSDCATVAVCVSTGTASGAWALITNKGSACQ